MVAARRLRRTRVALVEELPSEVTLKEAQHSARLATLASLKATLGDLDRVDAWLMVYAAARALHCSLSPVRRWGPQKPDRRGGDADLRVRRPEGPVARNAKGCATLWPVTAPSKSEPPVLFAYAVPVTGQSLGQSYGQRMLAKIGTVAVRSGDSAPRYRRYERL